MVQAAELWEGFEGFGLLEEQLLGITPAKPTAKVDLFEKTLPVESGRFRIEPFQVDLTGNDFWVECDYEVELNVLKRRP
jgi:hypothetical protein